MRLSEALSGTRPDETEPQSPRRGRLSDLVPAARLSAPAPQAQPPVAVSTGAEPVPSSAPLLPVASTELPPLPSDAQRAATAGLDQGLARLAAKQQAIPEALAVPDWMAAPSRERGAPGWAEYLAARQGLTGNALDIAGDIAVAATSDKTLEQARQERVARQVAANRRNYRVAPTQDQVLGLSDADAARMGLRKPSEADLAAQKQQLEEMGFTGAAKQVIDRAMAGDPEMIGVLLTELTDPVALAAGSVGRGSLPARLAKVAAAEGAYEGAAAVAEPMSQSGRVPDWREVGYRAAGGALGGAAFEALASGIGAILRKPFRSRTQAETETVARAVEDGLVEIGPNGEVLPGRRVRELAEDAGLRPPAEDGPKVDPIIGQRLDEVPLSELPPLPGDPDAGLRQPAPTGGYAPRSRIREANVEPLRPEPGEAVTVGSPMERQVSELERLAEATGEPEVARILRRQAAELDTKRKARSDQARERMERLRTVDVQQDDLLTAIRKWGGIDTELEGDFAGRFRHLPRPRPGLGGIERPGRGLSLDDLAEKAAEAGYISAHDAQELDKLLLRAETGEKIWSRGKQDFAGAVERPEDPDAPAGFGSDADFEWDDPGAAPPAGGWAIDTDTGTAVKTEPFTLDDLRRLDEEEAYAQRWFEQEGAEAGPEAAAGDAAVSGPAAPGPGREPPGDGRGAGGVRLQEGVADAGQRRAGAEPEPGEAFGLTGETPEELRARGDAERAAEAETARLAREAEQRARADVQRDGFTLTGSDRPVDELEARGQANLLDDLEGRSPARGRAGRDPGMAAAGTTIPRRQAAPPAGGQARPPRPDQIIQDLSDAFGVPIRYGRITNRNFGGVYRLLPGVVRRRRFNDIETVAHEVGHFMEEKFPELKRLMAAHGNELRPMAYASAQGKPNALTEGFAEFMRLRMSQVDEARRRAPRFFDALERLLDQYPKQQAAIARAVEDFDAWFSADPLARMETLIGPRPKPLGERVRGLGGRLEFELLDAYNPVKRWTRELSGGRELPAAEDPYKLARLAKGSDGIIDHFLRRGTLDFDFDARAAGPSGKSLTEVLEPVQDRIRDFELYMVARRARETGLQGRERLFRPEDVQAALQRLDSPEFRAAFDDLQAFQDAVLRYARDAGMLSGGLYAKVKAANRAYVPFKRILDDGPGGKSAGGNLANQGDPVYGLRGSSRNIVAPLQAVMDNTAMLITAANRNYAIRKMADLAEGAPFGGRAMERLPKVPKALKVRTAEVEDKLLKAGVVLDEDLNELLGEMLTLWRAKPKADRGSNQLLVRIDGEPVAFEVDPLLFESLAELTPPEMNSVEAVLAGVGRTLRAGVVFDPTYMVRNLSRDQLTAWVQSRSGFVPVLDGLRGAVSRAAKDDDFWRFMAFGGGQSSFWAANDREARRFLSEVLTKRGQRPLEAGALDWYLVDSARKAGRWIETLGEVTEMGSRMGEFKKAGGALAPGQAAAGSRLLDAALAGREVSTDFAMRGASRSLWFLTRITPFLNAGIQGLYKGARSATEGGFKKAFVPVATRVVSGMMLPSLALWWWTKDEDWYQDLPEWEKNMYWHLPPPAEGGEPVRIAKPFEWGFVGGSLPVHAIEAWQSDLKAREGEQFAEAAMQVFGLRVVPPSLQVPVELTANYNFFTGRPIVPEYVPEGPYDYTVWTSEAAKAVAKETGVSARKLEHAVRGLFGSLGTMALEGADVLMRASDPEIPARPARRLSDIPVAKAFFSRAPQGFSGPTAELYDIANTLADRSAELRKLEKEGRSDEAARLREQLAAEGAKAQEAMAKVATDKQRSTRKQIERIMRDREKSPRAKRSEIDALQRDANRTSREQLDRLLRFRAQRSN